MQKNQILQYLCIIESVMIDILALVFPELFEKHIEYLVEENINVLPITELSKYLKKKSVLLIKLYSLLLMMLTVIFSKWFSDS